uniref:Transcription factor bZIP13 n=1 Tax=Diospyros kaki TaxID=35925 RepID=A0A5Q2WXX6_DIOKA|nr:transcription factor bZIP13 [Diospyros kaki]
MASSSQLQSSGSEEKIMDQRKRKRMISNRESARRSRLRKQQHLDELTAQANQLRKENGYILTNVNVSTQMYLQAEAQNLILRAQLAELTHRLNSLNEIIDCLSCSDGGVGFEGSDDQLAVQIGGSDFLNPWNLLYLNQPVMASPDMIMS